MFQALCLFHASINFLTGSMMVIDIRRLSNLVHGKDVTDRLHLHHVDDEQSILIQTSESLIGMMLIFIAILLFMISYQQDFLFQRFFSKGCIIIHVLLALWRIFIESRVQALRSDIPKQLFTDFLFGATWVIFLLLKRKL